MMFRLTKTDRRRGESRRAEDRRRRRLRPTLLALEERKLLSGIVVNNPTDTPVTGEIDLRQAIDMANTDGGDEAITFDGTVFAAAQTITLTGGPLELSDTTGAETITGPSAGLTISGGGASRVFQVDKGVTATITGLTISGGQAASYGGGVSNSGTLTMTDCTVSGNTAGDKGSRTYNGGGIYNAGTLSLTGSTIAANSASGNYRGRYCGGLLNRGTLTVTGSTIADNSAGNNGGGGLRNSGTATLTDTIVVDNTAGSRPLDIVGTVAGTYDLIGVFSFFGRVEGVDNLVNVADPGLGALGHYGGPTETIPLLPGSPAIDAGTAAGAPTTDQRGEPRVGAVDIGAFESQGFVMAPVVGSTPQTATIGDAFANPLAMAVTANNPVEPVDGVVVSFVADPAANGASAILLASSSVIAGGQAGVTGGPDDVDGSYTVTASVPGLAPVSFDLTNSGPVLTRLVVSSTSGALFAEPGRLTLPLAVDFANADRSGNANISFDPGVFGAPQTITLTGTQLELSNTSEPITIDGPGVDALTIDAGGKSRVFAIDPGVMASISGLTVTGGASGGAYVRGGDLLNQGTLTLTGATVRGGYGYAGGGLSNSGTATLVDCTIADKLGNRGAGLFNLGTVTLEDCTVAGNTGVPAGGFESVSLGGGLFNSGSLTMIGGSVTGDTANYGSAIYSGYGTVTNLTGTTVRNNPTPSYDGIDRYAMIYNDGGAMSLVDCTISGNPSAPLSGFGIRNYYDGRLGMVDCTVEGFSNAGLFNSYSSTLSMSGCQIINNTGKGGLMTYGNATLTDCVISGNTTSGAGLSFAHFYGAGGGGVMNFGTLAMTDCLVDGNRDVAPLGQHLDIYGGGIYNEGTVTLTGCTMGDNMASGPGGALFNGGQATLTDCAVIGNSASVGGGIDNAGHLTATNVTLSRNSAVTGGGIANAAGATAAVSDSWIIDNAAEGDGGGVANSGTITLTGTRIRGNTAAADGGGLDNIGIAALTDCPVSGNSAASGGGIYAAPGGTVTLTGTPVANNKKDNIIGSVTYT